MKCSSFTCVPLHCQPQKASISVKPNTPKLQNVPLYKVHVQSSSSEKAHNKKCAGSPPAQVNGVKEQIHGSYQRTGSQNTLVKRLTYSSSLFDRAQKKNSFYKQHILLDAKQDNYWTSPRSALSQFWSSTRYCPMSIKGEHANYEALAYGIC